MPPSPMSRPWWPPARVSVPVVIQRRCTTLVGIVWLSGLDAAARQGSAGFELPVAAVPPSCNCAWLSSRLMLCEVPPPLTIVVGLHKPVRVGLHKPVRLHEQLLFCHSQACPRRSSA